jgi:hypothetical protein
LLLALNEYVPENSQKKVGPAIVAFLLFLLNTTKTVGKTWAGRKIHLPVTFFQASR